VASHTTGGWGRSTSAGKCGGALTVPRNRALAQIIRTPGPDWWHLFKGKNVLNELEIGRASGRANPGMWRAAGGGRRVDESTPALLHVRSRRFYSGRFRGPTRPLPSCAKWRSPPVPPTHSSGIQRREELPGSGATKYRAKYKIFPLALSYGTRRCFRTGGVAGNDQPKRADCGNGPRPPSSDYQKTVLLSDPG